MPVPIRVVVPAATWPLVKLGACRYSSLWLRGCAVFTSIYAPSVGMYLTDNDAEKTHLLITENEPQLPNELSVIAVISKCDKAKSFRPAASRSTAAAKRYDLSEFGK